MRQDKELEPHSDSIGMEEALDRNDEPRPTKSGECNAMMRTTPPFRADMVGSLLRTQPLKQARAEREPDGAGKRAERIMDEPEHCLGPVEIHREFMIAAVAYIIAAKL